MEYNKYYWANEEARVFLSRGYITETVEERIKNIAEKAQEYLGIEGFAEKFEDYMARGFYSLSTPVWINFAKEKGLPISCYGSNIDDSLDSILNVAREIGLMSKYGGGTSAYIGNIRPRGAQISTGGLADGPVHYSKIYDTVIDVCKQSEARRGACAIYLPIEHDDIDEFLEIGAEGNPIQNLQYGVTVTDAWLNEMKAGDTKKRKIWAKLIQRRSELGYPYIMYKDNSNKNTPYAELGYEINASNLCLTGDTQVEIILNGANMTVSLLELNGIFNLGGYESLLVKSYNIETGDVEFKKVVASAMISPNAKIIKITDDVTGKSIKCTPEHQIYTKNRGYVMAKDLDVNDEIVIS